MNLNSARAAWHSAYYQPWDSVMSHALEMAKLEASVQKTAKQRGAGHAVHQALAGRVQMAIDTLQGRFKSFGHYLYNPLATVDHREDAEGIVYDWAMQRVMEEKIRMTAAKVDKAFFVACGVLYRYRRMHQGGQSSCQDPYANPESFRTALYDTYGVRLDSRNWDRDWQGFIDTCFAVCNDVDRQALGPVAGVIEVMKEAA